MFDCVVIGGGPGGYRTAELLGKDGVSVALVEKNYIGGTCLNEGCIPFKNYLHLTRVCKEMYKLIESGCALKSNIQLNQLKIFETKEMLVKGLRQSVSNMLHASGVEVYYGCASIVDYSRGHFTLSVGDERIEAKKLVIASGSEDSFDISRIKGAAECMLIDSRTMLELTELPQSIDIIGGGVIGLEAACFFSDSGCKVTIIEASSQIGGHIDSEIADSLKRIMQKKGIDIITDSFLLDFEHDEVLYQKKDECISRKPQCVMTAIGRKPNIDGEMLNKLGIEYKDNGIIIDEFCKTSNADVYACGDVTGKLMLAHTAYHQAKVISDNIKGIASKTDYHAIPRVIYCNPEVLSVGYSEDDCRAQGIHCIAKSLPMTFSGKYFAENGKDGAKAKMIVDGKHRIIGFHMIGNSSSEMSLAVEMMIKNQMTCENIIDLTFAHPTYGEIISELALSILHD